MFHWIPKIPIGSTVFRKHLLGIHQVWWMSIHSTTFQSWSQSIHTSPPVQRGTTPAGSETKANPGCVRGPCALGPGLWPEKNVELSGELGTGRKWWIWGYVFFLGGHDVFLGTWSFGWFFFDWSELLMNCVGYLAGFSIGNWILCWDSPSAMLQNRDSEVSELCIGAFLTK